MPSSATSFDIQMKLVMLGNSGVGKTSLLTRYTDGSYSDSFLSTIGLDFKRKFIELDGTRIKMQIWDTAGQERFRTVTASYFRGAHAVLLVYDVTNRLSFDMIRHWISTIGEHTDENHVNKILFGNKCDVHDKHRVVSTEEGQKLADEFGLIFWECSAKNRINVDESFVCTAQLVKDRLVPDERGERPAAQEQAINFKLTNSTSKSQGRIFKLKSEQAKHPKRRWCW